MIERKRISTSEVQWEEYQPSEYQIEPDGLMT